MANIDGFPDNPVAGSDYIDKMLEQLKMIYNSYNMGIPYSFDGTLTLEAKFNVLFKTVYDFLNNNRELIETWGELYNWIKNYFQNLDVQEEINNKLDQIVASGQFDDILNSYFDSVDERITALETENTEIKNEFNKIQTILSKLQPNNIKTVGSNGCDFTTIQDAINYFKTNLTLQTFGEIKCAIIITPGEYDCAINDPTLGQIALIGIGNPILKSNSDYPVGNINCYGDILLYNLTFVCTSSTAYCYHFEGGGYVRQNGARCGALAINCNFYSSHIGVGIGALNSGTYLTFKNCDFRGTSYDIYLHNSTHDASNNNLIVFDNCIAGQSQIVRIEDAAKINANRSSRLDLIFRKNQFNYMSFYGGNQGTLANRTEGHIPINSENIILNSDSFGNYGFAFNYATRRITIEGYFPKINKGKWTYYNYTINFNRASDYNWTIYRVITAGGTNITQSCSINLPSGNNTIIVQDTTETDVGTMTNLSLIGTPKPKS